MKTIPQAPGPATKPTGAWGTLVTVAMGIVMVGLDGTVVSIANPAIGKSLHASLADLQWITNAYLLALAVALIPGGKLGDRYGRRLVFLIGVAGFTLSSVGVAVIGTVSGAIAMRAIQGLFGALLMPNTIALLRAAFPAEQFNRAVGIWSSSSAAAIAGAPVIGGLLVEKVNWQSVFLLNVPVGIATIISGILVMPESRESVRLRFDYAGLVLLATAVFCLVYGVIRSESSGWTSAPTLGLLAASVVLGVVFVSVERTSDAPLLPMHLFASSSISLGVVTLMLNFFALYGALFFVSLYFQNVQHLDAIQAGIRLLPLIGVFSATSPYAGRITTRFGARFPITFGLGLCTASLLSLVVIDAGTSFWLICPALVGIGLGIALVVVASTEAIIASAPVDEAGVAGGLQGIAIQLGGVLGSSILGSILAARVAAVLPSKLAAFGVPSSLGVPTSVVDQGVVPPPGGPALTAASHAAFLSGLHLALVLAGVATLLGAFCGPFIKADVSASDHSMGVHI
ncbi:MAG TPA: MFS transporter [Acidimicrobiales bacterium]|nr:MFS transporter [Acidimicrobiales bacterium]